MRVYARYLAIRLRYPMNELSYLKIPTTACRTGSPPAPDSPASSEIPFRGFSNRIPFKGFSNMPDGLPSPSQSLTSALLAAQSAFARRNEILVAILLMSSATKTPVTKRKPPPAYLRNPISRELSSATDCVALNLSVT